MGGGGIGVGGGRRDVAGFALLGAGWRDGRTVSCWGAAAAAAGREARTSSAPMLSRMASHHSGSLRKLVVISCVTGSMLRVCTYFCMLSAAQMPADAKNTSAKPIRSSLSELDLGGGEGTGGGGEGVVGSAPEPSS